MGKFPYILGPYNEQYLNYGCEAGHIDALTHVPVLEKALLGVLRLLLVDAELEVLVHDLLDKLLRETVIPFLGFDDIEQCIQSLCRLP